LVTLQTDFKQEVKKLDPSKSYLFVCRSGGRSTKAAQMAINCGVKRVFNLDGGMLEWNKL
jgi:rhodanese-related sulfurtransferase